MTTAFTTAKWESQHLSRPDWIDIYWQSQQRASREAVLLALDELKPFKTVMELGCHVGPMMARISEKYPDADVRGIDPNPVAVEHAKVPGVSLGNLMTWLPAQPSNSVDVIVTHYTLAYVHPNDILAVVTQCLRVCSKGVVFAEPTGPTKLIFEYPEWRHPYPGLLGRYASKMGRVEISEPPDFLNEVTVAAK